MEPQHRYCVIMAGGIGSRFWPMSRTNCPKQFHDILGTGRTLLQMTFDRMRRITSSERIYVVTNQDYRSLVQEQLPELEAEQILAEPLRRNTAPCVAYAAHKIRTVDPEACLVIAPSDHLIHKEETFVNTLDIAMDRANNADRLVTLGIKPDRPDTGYGYIQFQADGKEEGAVRKVLAFTEKPDKPKADEFLERGDHYWNAGIFIWHVQSILQAFEEYLPELEATFREGQSYYNGPDEAVFIEHAYGNCPDLSIDHGIMEKAQNVDVVLADIGWSDLGTWGAIYELMDKDEDSNAVLGEKAMLYDSQGSLVRVPDDKLVVLQGMKDMIVVESDGILLICQKGDEQRIKSIREDVKQGRGEDYV